MPSATMPAKSSSSSASISSTSSAAAGPSQPRPPQDKLPPLLPLSSFPAPQPPIHSKPSGYDFYRNVLNSPRYVVAPMVAGSELPWRYLSRRMGGADLCYSPMISSSSLVTALKGKGKGARRSALAWFDTETGEEGHGEDDKLIAQLAGNDPAVILEAAQHLQDHCLAIDLNLGCPQHIAKRGHYGSFLQEDWPLIHSIISTLHHNLRIPVTAKMRVFPGPVDLTIAYARMLEHAGAQIITVHGRTREQKGHKTGLADWEKIKAVKEAVQVPVLANGNVLYREDVKRCLEMTGADGVMSAEGNLYNPLIFADDAQLDALPAELILHRGDEAHKAWREFAYIPALANAYLDDVARCRKKVDGGAVKGHIFKICRPALEKHKEVRGSIGKAQLRYAKDGEEAITGEAVVVEYREAMKELDSKLQLDRTNPIYLTAPSDFTSSSLSGGVTEERYIPHWLAQPYFRPALPDNGQHDGSNKKGASIPVDTKDEQSKGEKRVVEEEEKAMATSGEANKKQLLEEATALKQRANALFEKGSYEAAIAEYRDALAVLPPKPVAPAASKTDEETAAITESPIAAASSSSAAGEQLRELTPAEEAEEERLANLSPEERQAEEEQTRLEHDINELRTTLWSNMAASEIKLERWQRAKEACDEALALTPTHLKSLHRRSTALESLSTYPSLISARLDILTLLSHPATPAHFRPTLRSTLSRIEKKRDEEQQRERDEMLGKLKGLGDKALGWFGLSTDNFRFEKNAEGGYGVKFQR